MKKSIHPFTAALVTVLLTVGSLMAGLQNASAEDNGIGLKPVLGWSSWSFIRKDPTAAKIKAQAQALKHSGLQALGYEYINIDDFWYRCPGPQGPDVDEYGRWVTDTSRFPSQGDANGIKAIADYVHSLGMKFGIYLTPGISMQAVKKNTPIQGTRYTADQIARPSVEEDNYNCKGMVAIDYTKPGAQQYINSVADMFASWDVDYIKLDGMFDRNVPDIKAWSKAIRQSGRPMLLNITWGRLTPAIAPVLMKYTNQWVVTPDLECYDCEKNGSSYPLTSWKEVVKRFDIAARWQPYAGPGHFNDYDSIEVGNGDNNGITPDERKTQLSLWSLAAGPLILGVDLTHLDPQDLELLKNKAIIAVDQDAIAAKRIVNDGVRQVFAKTEPNGDVIVGLFNRSERSQKVSVQASAVGLPAGEGSYSLKNLWTGKTEKANSTISATVPPHGVALYRVTAR
ncbi:MAG: glycoside hydrolase family 27 protein [Acidobacteriaceae bacterium]